jgi:hypothetical protein
MATMTDQNDAPLLLGNQSKRSRNRIFPRNPARQPDRQK